MTYVGSITCMDLTCNSTFHNATLLDVNQTVYVLQLTTAAFAFLFYLALTVLSFLGVCFKACIKVFSSQATFALFLTGTVMVCVNIYTNSGNQDVKVYFRLATGGLVGIAFVLAGAALFFSKPKDVPNQSTLAQQQPSMGLVVGVITFLLLSFEALLIVATSDTKKVETSEALQTLWPLILADKSTFLFQKFVQALIYILVLRYKTICPKYRESAKFYLKTLAFYNFIEWIDSQVNEESDFALSHSKLFYGAWFDVFADFLYKALIIDYRLLCSLLFLEHSLEDEREEMASEIDERVTRHQTNSEKRCRAGGYMLCGLLSVTASICCGLYYHMHDLHAAVHVVAIIVNLAIVGFGALFLWKNDLKSNKKRKKGLYWVKIMVCCLGAVGFTCWMIKVPISGYWAVTAKERLDIDERSYFAWVAFKNAARGISTAFLIALFLKVDPRSLPQNNPDVKINHFLVPAMIMMILGTFSEALIDQHVGPLESRLRRQMKGVCLDILLEVGPTMYLGFLIHMIFHFVIIETEIIKPSRSRPVTSGYIPLA